MTRSTVQKSVVVVARSPHVFVGWREKLSLVTRAWFLQRWVLRFSFYVWVERRKEKKRREGRREGRKRREGRGKKEKGGRMGEG